MKKYARKQRNGRESYLGRGIPVRMYIQELDLSWTFDEFNTIRIFDVFIPKS